jgi:hypothetical protein
MNYLSFHEIPDLKEGIKYLIFILILTGCTSVNCPSFPEEGLEWMPYKQGDTVSFTDGTDTFQLNVNKTYRTSAYTIKKAFSYKETCEVIAYAELSGNSSLPQFLMTGMSANLPRFYTISFTGLTNLIFGIDSNGRIFSNDSGFLTENLAEYYNGFKEYSNVVEVAYDTIISYETQIYQAYVAKNVGVIQFKDRFNHRTWSLIEK